MEAPQTRRQWSGGTAVIITGGASGLGRAAALAFAAAAGQHSRLPRPLVVVVADIDMAGGQETCAMAIERGADGALFVETDVADEGSVAHLADEAADRFFDTVVYALINAGVEGTRAATDAYPTDEFDRVMAVNVRGSWLTLKHLLPLLEASPRSRGAAVVTSSTAGLAGMAEFGPYCASKHALLGLVRSAAREYAGRVRINAVCPATTDTPMVARFEEQWPDWQAATNASYPMGRIARPQEVADAMLWLCTGATFTTGSHIVIDGGAGA
ncbi:MAG: hypothetical protein J3K34DRAFT_412865 [Monoraphidium minutum]|nr:MAG: hypothetical protein J3K34DRAFT_412865 [Monoraphidium minutum]